jgi:RNA polymerase sigma-70 factor (ECF subfamily)
MRTAQGGRLAPRRLLRQSSDTELAREAADGSTAAFEILLTRHRRLIRSICAGICPQGADRDDAYQAASAAIWRGLASFKGEARFTTWAYTVASRAALAIATKRPPTPIEASRLHAVVPPVHSHELQLTDAAALSQVLSRIPPEYREALILFEVAGLSHEEIATIQICAVGTVKSRVSRARKALADLLIGGDS